MTTLGSWGYSADFVDCSGVSSSWDPRRGMGEAQESVAGRGRGARAAILGLLKLEARRYLPKGLRNNKLDKLILAR
jgi:hypothetical protein